MELNGLSPQGALELSRRITLYWEKRGLQVRCSAVKVRFTGDSKTVPSNMWGIRSNLRFDARGNAYTVEDDT